MNILILLILFLTTAASAMGQSTDSGIIKKETRFFPAAKYIEIKSIPGDININIGDENKILITADSYVIEAIESISHDGILTLRPKKNISTNSKIVIDISVNEIISLHVDGLSNINLYNIGEDILNIESSGGSSFSGNGFSNTLNIKMVGNGKIHFKNFESMNCSIKINGNGYAEVNASGDLYIDINGIGKVLYHGNPIKVQRNITGIGTVVNQSKDASMSDALNQKINSMR